MILYKLAYLTQKLYQLAYILRPTRYFYPIILLTLRPACTFSTYPFKPLTDLERFFRSHIR